MLVPKKVKVAGHTYKVSFENKRLICERLSGDANHGTHRIGLTDLLPSGEPCPETFVEDVFIHEVFHAVDVQYNNGVIPEEQVRRMATGLHQVLGDLGWLPRNQKQKKMTVTK